jgi:hypothetical protein
MRPVLRRGKDKYNIRSDQTANTNRLFGGPYSVAWYAGGNDVAVCAGSFLAEPLEEVGSVGGLASGIRKRLSVLPGNKLGNILRVLHGEVVPLAQQLRALAAGQISECLEGFSGSGDGGLGIGGCEFGACCDDFASSGVFLYGKDKLVSSTFAGTRLNME